MAVPIRDPIEAFHREILAILHWSVLREEFCTRFLDVFDSSYAAEENVSRGRGWGRGRGRGAVQGEVPEPVTAQPPPQSAVIAERHRFRRHCKEALGKWILSQKARDAECLSFYFPSRLSVAQPSLPLLPKSATCTTYDDQLIRDLTMKCTKEARDVPTFADDVRQFVQVTFSLAERCYAAHDAIEATVAGLGRPNEKRRRVEGESQPNRTLAPIVTFISSEEKSLETHKRIQGDVVEISVDMSVLEAVFKDHFNSNKSTLDTLFNKWNGQLNTRFVGALTRIVVPRVAWDKLFNLYSRSGHTTVDTQRFGDTVDAFYANLVSIATLRCATLAYRYEGNLATGSLQLCADESLKRLLSTKGFHVVDLCASPINAFQTEDHNSLPVNFCSAFADTDVPFGSLGSATVVDLQSYMNAWSAKVPSASAFLFTLDVPYDEDLCNMLFLKLSDDCTAGKVDTRAAFLLVLPLWWDLAFKSAPKVHLSSDKSEDVEKAIRGAVSYMQEGFPVDYPWPSVLGECDWACFDAVFVKDSYSYFCTATNKLLSGVTATEVIGFESPKGSNNLRLILNDFYKI